MSDANFPPQNQGVPESIDPSDREPLQDNAASEELKPQPNSMTHDADWEDWQTVTFPNTLNIEGLEAEVPAIADQEPEAIEAASEVIIEPDWQSQEPTDDLPAEASLSNEVDEGTDEGKDEATLSTLQISELLTLVRDLNQCNDALLNRMRYLEETLEVSQSNLQAERTRSQEQARLLGQKDGILSAAQADITRLTNDLEFARQTAQRHEIRIETLVDQLETSQQRVAQLERECTLIRQQQQEQAYGLQEANQTCRDLRSRLQRQQRYTLQFKVALEKCLDVPPPRYESALEAAETGSADLSSSQADGPMLPKVQQIAPWSSQSPVAPVKFTWSPPDAEDEHPSDLSDRPFETDALFAASNDLASSTEDPLATDLWFDAERDDVEPIPSEISAAPDEETTPAAEPPAPISYELTASSSESGSESSSDPSSSPDEAENDAIAAFASALASQPQAAEDALWQDLARLIDASTDALSNTEATEDICFDAPQDAEPSTGHTPSETDKPELPSNAPIPPDASTPTSLDAEQLLERFQAEDNPSLATETHPEPQPHQTDSPTGTPQSSESDWSGEFAMQPSWPSPVVYPLRPHKRRKSLAAVELPSFPKAHHH